MANLYSFSGFLLGDLSRTNLSGNPPSTANIGNGDQFDIAGTPAHSIIISDTAGETTLEGDPGGEVSNDAQNDQIAFIKDENGVVVIDGSEIYIESIFLFTINGQTFKGFQLEIVGTGEDFVVFPPGVPAGTVTVEFVDFSPNPDAVAYEEMTSGDEEIDDADFTNLNSGGSDSIVAGSGDDTINAEGGADTIEAGAGNDDISAGGGNDVVLAGEGGDTVSAGGGADSVLGGLGDDDITGEAGNDTLFGGLGDDTIDGGDNNDLISGDEQEEIRVDLSLNWNLAPDPDNGGVIDSGDDISNGEIGTGDADFTTSFSQETGGITATVSFRDNGQATEFEYDTVDNVVTGLGAENEVANVESSLFLGGDGLGDTSTTRIEFASTDGTFLDEVENVSFRVNDIDDSGWRDTVRITAFDADDNPITVNLTAGANITLTDTDGVAGNDTATADNGTGNLNPDDAAGSLLVEIPGPVARIEIDYGNLETDGQRINVTDIFFQAVRDTGADVEGDDLLSGGAGADTISGNGGDDTIDGGTGSDSLTGGAGFDDFIVSAGADELTDFSQDPDQVLNDGDQDNNDFIDLDPFYDNYFEARADLADDGLLNQSNALDTKGRAVDYNDNTALPGTIAMMGTNTDDLFFDNTNIVCFASGAMIRTPEGERPVEQIRVGDLVDTRDHGPQPVRWVGARALSAEALNAQPRLRPVVISAGALGNARTLRVSPQHRMLVKSWRAEMLFGAAEVLAKAIDLVDGDRIWQADEGAVTYHHILFDQHEIIFAEGAESESLYPGDQALGALDEDARGEILALFPELATARRPLARQPLKGHEARALSQL